MILNVYFSLHFCVTYSETTQTRALGRRLSNQNVVLKTKDSQVLCKQTNNINKF